MRVRLRPHLITSGGNGTLTVNGPDTLVTVANDMAVRSTGTATLQEGELDIGGVLSLDSGAALQMDNGVLSASLLTGAASSMTWNGGQLNITGGDFSIDASEPLGANVSMGKNHLLDVAGAWKIGANDLANVIATNGATLSSAAGQVGGTDQGVLIANMTMASSSTAWTMTGDLSVSGAETLGAELSVSQGAMVSNQNALVATTTGTTAAISIGGSSTQWYSSGSAYLGDDAASAGGAGTLEVIDGAEGLLMNKCIASGQETMMVE